MKPTRVPVFILAFLAFVISGIGGLFGYSSYDFSTNAVVTTGTVMSVSARYSDGSTSYQPIIAFIDHNGTKRSGPTFLSSSSYNYRVGDQVGILYDIRDPQNLRVNNWFALWGFGTVFIGVGVVLAVSALIVARITRRPKAGRAPSDGAHYSYSSNVRREDSDTQQYPHRKAERQPTVRRR